MRRQDWFKKQEEICFFSPQGDEAQLAAAEPCPAGDNGVGCDADNHEVMSSARFRAVKIL